jgi:hypothetical protein
MQNRKNESYATHLLGNIIDIQMNICIQLSVFMELFWIYDIDQVINSFDKNQRISNNLKQ